MCYYLKSLCYVSKYYYTNPSKLFMFISVIIATKVICIVQCITQQTRHYECLHSTTQLTYPKKCTNYKFCLIFLYIFNIAAVIYIFFLWDFLHSIYFCDYYNLIFYNYIRRLQWKQLNTQCLRIFSMMTIKIVLICQNWSF